MPSEIPKPQGSSQYLLPEERQAGIWKMDHSPSHYGLRSFGVSSSTVENRIPLDSQKPKGFDHPEYYTSHGQIGDRPSLGKHIFASSHSLPSGGDHDLVGARNNLNKETTPYFMDGDRMNLTGFQYENSLFSSSMSDLFNRKLTLSSNNDEDDAFVSLKELEAQTIGNLLPDDDDLLSGVTDSINPLNNNGKEMEDLDLFSSVGGMELDQEGSGLQSATGFSASVSRGGTSLSMDHMFYSSTNLPPPSLVRGASMNRSIIGESRNLRNNFQGTPNLHQNSLPLYHDSFVNRPPFGSPSNISSAMDNQQFRRVMSSGGHSVELNEGFGGRHYMWSNNPPRPQSIAWPNSPSFVNPANLHSFPRSPSQMMNHPLLLPMNTHHVGSAPLINHHQGSLGNSPHPLEFVPHNIFIRNNGMEVPTPSQSSGNHRIFPARGQIASSFGDSTNERNRNHRRNEGSSNQQDNKKQFELDLERIVRGDDKRTTLMLKNIPNKYTSKMLLTAIDERHRGTYDFIYLPIDFKNKCNVGYAFINMTDPSLIVPFSQTFNGKKWEKFNSEKVATLAYARIQGKSALIAHFQNSSLMNEDKRCRPILFHTDGPNAGDQVPFPMGTNIRSRAVKVRASTSEEINQEIPSFLDDDEYFNGNPFSGSGK